MEPVLSLQNIGFCYGQHSALTSIDLRLMDGEILGIIGPNGSGKSTLLKIMGGLLTATEWRNPPAWTAAARAAPP